MSGVYEAAPEHILAGNFRWLTNLIRVALLSSEYVYSPAHRYLNAIPQSAVITAAALTGRRTAIRGGKVYALCNPVVFHNATPSRDIAGAVLYSVKSTRALSPLVVFWDGPSITLRPDYSELTLTFPDDEALSL